MCLAVLAVGRGPVVLMRLGSGYRRLLPCVRCPAAGSRVPWGCRGPQHGAGWGAPPLLSARRPLHWGGESGAGCQVPPGTAGGCQWWGGVHGLPQAGQRAGSSAAQGGGTQDAGPAPCPSSPVGVCGVSRGPGTTGRNRFDWPGKALSRSAGVELAQLTLGCRRPTQPPGIGDDLGAIGRSWALMSACVGCPASLCRVTSGSQS